MITKGGEKKKRYVRFRLKEGAERLESRERMGRYKRSTPYVHDKNSTRRVVQKSQSCSSLYPFIGTRQRKLEWTDQLCSAAHVNM